MKKVLSINGGEVARIEDNKYYICVGDYGYECMEQVDKEAFKNYLLHFSWVPNGWNQELREQYNNMLEEVI